MHTHFFKEKDFIVSTFVHAPLIFFNAQLKYAQDNILTIIPYNKT